MRDDRRRLQHILEAITHIERYAGRGEKAFRSDELIQNWMVRHIQIIGEAARALSPGRMNAGMGKCQDSRPDPTPRASRRASQREREEPYD